MVCGFTGFPSSMSTSSLIDTLPKGVTAITSPPIPPTFVTAPTSEAFPVSFVPALTPPLGAPDMGLAATWERDATDGLAAGTDRTLRNEAPTVEAGFEHATKRSDKAATRDAH